MYVVNYMYYSQVSFNLSIILSVDLEMTSTWKMSELQVGFEPTTTPFPLIKRIL